MIDILLYISNFILDCCFVRRHIYNYIQVGPQYGSCPMTAKPDKHQHKAQRLRTSGTLNRNPKRVTDPLFSEHAFFDTQDLVQIKYEMLRRVLQDGRSITEAAAAFGFSRPAFYKARRALAECGLAGLVPAKTGPRGAHKLNDQVMAFVLATKEAEPALDSRDLVERIAAQFDLTVHPRSVERALARKKKPSPRPSNRNGVDDGQSTTSH